MPLNVTSSYKKRWKFERDELCKFNHIYHRDFIKHQDDNRYHSKDFQKQFNRKNVSDMSSYSKNKRISPANNFIRFSNYENLWENEKDDDEEDYDIKFDEIQQKTKSFNERLRNDPRNVDLWLEYVDFQDIALAETDFTITPENPDGEEPRKLKKSQRERGNVVIRTKAIVERKLAILKSAMESNPRSVVLLVKRLNLQKEILEDSKTLNGHWEELISIFPEELNAWDEYLRFLTSYFTTFTVSKITGAFQKCFSKLKEMSYQAFGHDPSMLENQMTNIIIRLAHLWAKSGYRERSMGLFQALLEFNLYSPKFPGYYSSEDKLERFEYFWNSSVPKFGEPGAQGWSKFLEMFKNHKIVEEEDDDEEDEEISRCGGNVYFLISNEFGTRLAHKCKPVLCNLFLTNFLRKKFEQSKFYSIKIKLNSYNLIHI